MKREKRERGGRDREGGRDGDRKTGGGGERCAWERLRERGKELERDKGDEKRKGGEGGSIDRMTDRQINRHVAVSIDVACC